MGAILRIHALALALLIAVPTAADAQGVGLAWGDCGPSGGVNQQFACDTNTGEPFALWLSVWPPEGIDDYVGFVATLKLLAWDSVLPDWWSLGACRAMNSLLVEQGVGESSCPELTASAHTFLLDVDLLHGGPNRVRLRVFGAPAPGAAISLSEEQEASLCRLVLNRSRTVASGGTPVCGGCSVRMCLTFESVLLETRDPRSSRTVASGASNIVSWNNRDGGAPCHLVPTYSRTWGAIKSLYR